jgi:hypothetical protein
LQTDHVLTIVSEEGCSTLYKTQNIMYFSISYLQKKGSNQNGHQDPSPNRQTLWGSVTV